jgi:hypothetical protein
MAANVCYFSSTHLHLSILSSHGASSIAIARHVVQRPGLAPRGSAFRNLQSCFRLHVLARRLQGSRQSHDFNTHRFDTAILRVNKAIHRLARSHLHHNLTWIRFDINWGSFLIDPHWLGIPYIAIDRKDTQCEISYPYVSYVERRSSNQQTLEGNISVHIKFPPPATDTQKGIWNNASNLPTPLCRF